MKHIRDLIPDPKNARRHTPRNVGMVEHSIQRDGFGRSILVAKDGTIIAGNATVEAAASAGIENVIVVESDGKSIIAVKRTDIEPGSPEFTALAISDNRAAELAEWDAEVLQSFMDDGVDLEQFWFEDELDLLLNGEDDEPMGGNTDPDDVPDVPEEPTTKPGDLWLLGRHRLLCGDSTVVTDIEKVMGGERADIAFTSPPYNIAAGFTPTNRAGDYLSKGTPCETYSDNLGEDDYQRMLSDALLNMLTVADDACLNIGITKGSAVGLFRFVGEHAQSLTTVMFWNKTSAMPMAFESQRGAVNNKVEPVFCFSMKSGRCFQHPQFEPGEVDNIFETRNASGNENAGVHGATFPIELPAYFIQHFTRPRGGVLDVFCGTGTTLLACETLGRTGYGVELDPAYVDVAVRRWEQFTGQTATLADETSMVKE